MSIKSKGRIFKQDPDPYRSEFQRDVHRILYSQPFRRLRHKTQVFFLVNNDHVCTRLEHSLYVASASRTVARFLKLNEDLTEAIGLGHDLGHAPFGHPGEEILTEIAKNAKLLNTTFCHEVHGLRIVDVLGLFDRESLPGLNLTYEVRDGIISHNGENYEKEREIMPWPIKKDLSEIKTKHEAKNPTTLEGCIVRIVDKIAYAGRDLEDGLTAELIKEKDIPKDLKNHLGYNNGKIVKTLMEDLIKESSKYEDRICLSPEKHELLVKLINFNYKNIYKTVKAKKYKAQATAGINALFPKLCCDLDKSERFREKGILPDLDVYKTFKEFIKDVCYREEEKNEQIVFDFISGMTDNYVIRCIDEIFIPKAIV